jgi:putative transposase
VTCQCQARHPFTVIAIVLLHDHLHAIWELPPDDDRYSMRWNWIKRQFTLRWLAQGENHFDYIHYNPVKHKYVTRPRDWPHSSFHRWVARGHYDINWGAGYTPPQLPGDAGEGLEEDE